MMGQKSVLFVFRHSPYGSAVAREGLEALLAAGVFEQEIAALFLNDGVLQLTKHQQPAEAKNHGRMLGALPLYGIDKLYADAASLEERNLQPEELLLPAEIVSADKVRNILGAFDQILSF